MKVKRNVYGQIFLSYSNISQMVQCCNVHKLFLLTLINYLGKIKTVIILQFPSLCSYHNATYHVVIEDTSGRMVHTVGPHIRYWRESSASVTLELRERGLQLNKFYRAIVTVSTLAGEESTMFTFSKKEADYL